VVLAGLLCTGCYTSRCSEGSFVRPFDAQRVAQLSHNAYKVAWEARFWAREELIHLPSRNPTVLDFEALHYINDLLNQTPWIAHDIEKNPGIPRCSSKTSYDLVTFDAIMLKARYHPDKFTPPTNVLIERLIQLTDEISTYYELKTPVELPPEK
jgi:hypothetical protein